MNIKQFAEELRNTVQQLQREGVSEIKSENLIAYLEQVIESASGGDVSYADMERYRAELQLWVEQNKVIHTSRLEMFKSVIATGQNALRTAFLMNGGATVALLAFLGKLSEQHQSQIPVFAASLILFVIGVLTITISSGVTYLSQWFYAGSDGWKVKTGFCFNILAIILGLSSYFLFIWGVVRAYKAFIGFA